LRTSGHKLSIQQAAQTTPSRHEVMVEAHTWQKLGKASATSASRAEESILHCGGAIVELARIANEQPAPIGWSY
jgi:hypothetical protein